MGHFRNLPPSTVIADLMEDEGLSANALAIRLGVPASRVTSILKNQRAISADTAIRLGHYFGNGAAMWLRLQANFELEQLETAQGDAIRAQVRPPAA